MEEILGETMPEVDTEEDTVNTASLQAVASMAEHAGTVLALQDGDGHAPAMDQIHKETLKHAQDLMDLGYNVDQRSAATIFEKATMMYKVAQDAKDSKRKYQIEAIKLMQNQKKLDMEERRLQHEMGQSPIVDAEATIVEDRNELIRRLRAQAREAE